MIEAVWGQAVKLVARIEGSSAAAGLLLLGIAVLCALWTYLRSAPDRSLSGLIAFMFPREILTHRSARADLMFWILRAIIFKVLMLPSGVLFIGSMAYGVYQLGTGVLGLAPPAAPAGPVMIVFFTLSMVLASDLSYYLYHVAQHRIPFLWELHKVHHSAEVLVGITKDRVHPLDDVMNRMWDAFLPGITLGIWSLFALNPVEATVFGINVYLIRNVLMMDFLRHTHLPISFGPLNALILPPHWHQLHHSAETRHYDRNFGLLFSFWDRLFGTLMVPAPGERFTYGIGEREGPAYQTLFGLYLLPLQRMAGHIRRWLTPRAGRAARSPQT